MIRDANALPPLPVLWLTAAGLVAQTVAELRRFLPSLAVIASESVEGGSADRQRTAAYLQDFPNGPDTLVTTHALADARRKHLEALAPPLVVVDEASALKGAGTRHEAVRYISEASDRVDSPKGLAVLHVPLGDGSTNRLQGVASDVAWR